MSIFNGFFEKWCRDIFQRKLISSTNITKSALKFEHFHTYLNHDYDILYYYDTLENLTSD